MEDTESTTRERTPPVGRDKGNQMEGGNMLLNTSKPLHRFVGKEPKSIGIAILIFGCGEFLMGFNMLAEEDWYSGKIYIPFWQGLLFIVCGSLSIYTEVHPTKKMVTVCLAMYVVALLGVIISAGYRIYCLTWYSYMRRRRYSWERYGTMTNSNAEQVFVLEALLLTISLCVSGLLIFLCVVARLALKSTRSQFTVRHIRAPVVSDTTST